MGSTILAITWCTPSMTDFAEMQMQVVQLYFTFFQKPDFGKLTKFHF